MKKAIGILCMILGAALVSGALWLFNNNQKDEKLAESMAEEYLPKIIEIIEEKTENQAQSQTENQTSENTSVSADSVPQDVHNPNGDYVSNMLVTEIDGYDFIGYISVPKLNINLPVVSQTDMDVMKVVPCRFSGSPKTNDLVIGAHNYKHHFGNIDKLVQGDKVIFTDIEGTVWKYKVEFTEILIESESKELINSQCPLTLYTCSYDGNSRITVRCVVD